MNLKNFAIFFGVLFMLQSCNHAESRIVSFEYGHYDTTFAILKGEVYQSNKNNDIKDSLKALQAVIISSVDSATGKEYASSVTDANGRFVINFLKNGTFNITATKPGFQPAKITNYLADTGQVSTVKIILEKDNKLF